MSNRQNWRFPYPAAVLHKAANEKQKHHNKRAKWWDKKQSQVMTTIRKKGIEIDQSLALQYGSSTVERGARIKVHADLQLQLNECHGKISEHVEKAKSYENWIQMLGALPKQAQYDLDVDDYAFFFGK